MCISAPLPQWQLRRGARLPSATSFFAFYLFSQLAVLQNLVDIPVSKPFSFSDTIATRDLWHGTLDHSFSIMISRDPCCWRPTHRQGTYLPVDTDGMTYDEHPSMAGGFATSLAIDFDFAKTTSSSILPAGNQFDSNKPPFFFSIHVSEQKESSYLSRKKMCPSSVNHQPSRFLTTSGSPVRGECPCRSTQE